MVTSLLSWTVEYPAQLETPAHLAKLLGSPAQVGEELQLWCDFLDYFISSGFSVSAQNPQISGWWERTAAVLEHWS